MPNKVVHARSAFAGRLTGLSRTRVYRMQNRSMPSTDVIPELPYTDVEAAVGWLCAAFGFRQRLRIGGHRAQIAVGSGAVVAVLARGPVTASSIMVRVSDVDAHYRIALQSGAQVSGPPMTHPYGERQYSAQDLAGHRWTFSQSIADIDPTDWGGELIGESYPGRQESS